ncbi:MAG: pyruvate formate lyase-activating protein [Clostridia bacterium]|nr:pyruvate formate lyase-activating protein [Clostridia bacterium]
MSGTGKIHSFQSLGAVDGPGVRFVVFLQGCPYRCPYCHNPDTRPFFGGTEYTADEIVAKAQRYRTYFGEKGGVTVSGGEPLMQAEFVAELFEKLHANGINTALDTAGVKITDAVKRVLRSTDTVLCDIKFPSDEQYKAHIGTGIDTVLDFIDECNKTDADVVIRHVVVPGLTDSEDSIRQISELAKRVRNLSKIELLPFKKLCVQKYDELGIEFPLSAVPECDAETISKLKAIING